MRIDVRDNFASAQAAMRENEKQATYATAVALTRTAQDVRADEKQGMQSAFDRPTPFTLNALFLKPAKKTDLTARVWLKDYYGPNFLMPQIEGGGRPQKRFEQLLMQRGLLKANERVVPGAGAKLDSYGNMSRGQIVQILSQLQAFNVSGFDANATGSKRSKAKRARESYFFSTGKGTRPFGRRSWKAGRKVQHLERGVWVRMEFGATHTVVLPVLLFVSGVRYRKRYPFLEIAEATVQRQFPGHFDREYARALASARPTKAAS